MVMSTAQCVGLHLRFKKMHHICALSSCLYNPLFYVCLFVTKHVFVSFLFNSFRTFALYFSINRGNLNALLTFG